MGQFEYDPMRLFISYAREDTARIEELVSILRDGGHEPWFDHSLIVGLDWQDQLLEAIKSCEGFVYTLTPASVESEWCLWEFTQAVELKKAIIPILLDKATPIPEFINHRQYADFSGGATGNAVARLLRGIQTISATIKRKQLPQAPQEPEGTPSRIAENVDEDFHKAVALARIHHGISISLLQRELQMGYPRARRIIEMMTKEGIIGAYPGGGKLRPLLVKAE